MKILGLSVVLICLLVAASSVTAQEAATPAADQPVAAPAADAPAAAPVAAPAAPAMPPPLELRKTGVVSVTKDASGKVSAIKLIVTSYEIILDEGSKVLETMDGQKVRVTGTFSMQENKRCFTVKGVEPMTDEMKAPGAPAAAKPAEAAPAK